MSVYSTRFEKAVHRVLEDEGGYVNDPQDPGGETKYGISKRSYPNVNIKYLTKLQAVAIYHTDWWAPGPYEAMIHDELASKLFNTAVNMGDKRAFRFLQEAANELGAKLVVDGIIGPRTIRAINNLNGTMLLSAFRRRQEQYYLDLIAARPSLGKYKNGWITRARS
jgi:lysozyme family protein